MLAKCCNPECDTPFDYREGRLIRCSRKPQNGSAAEGDRFIRHYWLCGKCVSLFVLECDSRMTVRIKPRHEQASAGESCRFVSAA